MSPLVEPLHIVVASQEAVSGLQFTPQQVQEVIGKVAPPVVDLAHYNVSGSLATSRGNVKVEKGRGLQIFTKHAVVNASANLSETC